MSLIINHNMAKRLSSYFWISTLATVRIARTCSSLAPSKSSRSSFRACSLVNPTSPRSKRAVSSTSRAAANLSTFTKVGFPLPRSISPTLWRDRPARSATCSWVMSLARRNDRSRFPKIVRISPIRPSFSDSLGQADFLYKQVGYVLCL